LGKSTIGDEGALRRLQPKVWAILSVVLEVSIPPHIPVGHLLDGEIFSKSHGCPSTLERAGGLWQISSEVRKNAEKKQRPPLRFVIWN
jgi:hypothetical protein